MPRLGSGTASQSERFCRTNRRLSDKNTARYCLATVNIRPEEMPTMVWSILRNGFLPRCRSGCNITTSPERIKTVGEDWSGQERTSGPDRGGRPYFSGRNTIEHSGTMKSATYKRASCGHGTAYSGLNIRSRNNIPCMLNKSCPESMNS